MKFSIGDKVVLKNTDEEGIVIAYVSDDMLEVEVEGITFPVHIDELDHPYLKWFTQKKQVKSKRSVPEQLPVEKQKLRKPRLAKGIYLSFFPEYKIEEMEDVVDYLKVYILNELPKEIQFQYDLSLGGTASFSHEGKLQGFGHIYLHNIPFEQMNDAPKINWQIDDLEDPAMAPMEGVLKLKPQKVFQQIEQILINNEPSFSYLLFDDFRFLEKGFTPFLVPSISNTSTGKVSVADNSIEQPKYELDLHIEHLVDDYKGLTNIEIIDIQLAELKKYLRLAINAKQERMVVVHGLGKGRLRDEVHKILSTTFEVDTFSNEWHGRYGFGATEVLLVY